MTGPMKGLGLDEIEIGARAEDKRTVTANDLVFYSHASGDLNPLHLPELDGDGDGSPEAIAPTAYLAGLVSALIGSKLPGPGSRETRWLVELGEPVRLGETVTTTIEIAGKQDDAVVIDASVDGPAGRALTARVEAKPPERPSDFETYALPDLLVRRHAKFERLLAACDGIDAARVAVVCPYSEDSLEGAFAAAERKLIEPILVGERDKIETAARDHGRTIDTLRIVEAGDAREAAEAACGLVRSGEADSVMKGHLHSDTLLRAVLDRTSGLRGDGRLSHVFIMDVPGVDQLLFVTDAAVNISPDLQAKAGIVQNAINVARAMGVAEPKAGVLSAVETVNPALPSTLDAAALAKMSERGQIKGGVVDGPLAMDNAVDLEAARIKGLKGEVAGRADILVAPNLEAGNMLAKELTFVARAEAAGLVVGARAPVILTSRADSEFSRLVSCAAAALYTTWLQTGEIAPGLKRDQVQSGERSE